MGIFSDGLNSQIQSNKEKMNQYEADQEKYRQAVADAKKSADILKQSSSNMDQLIQQTYAVFQGNAADAFINKLLGYNKAVKGLARVMENKAKTFERRIKEIETSKFWCQVWTNILTSWMNSLKFFAL